MLRTLREQLFDTFRTDQDFDAFCQDFFPEAYRRFGMGMDRVAKTNLLFALVLENDIVRGLTQLSSQSGQKAQAATPVTAQPAVPAVVPATAVLLGNPLELTFGHVKAACARLTTADAQGTGYLVRPDRLVTCAHVVRSVGIGGNVQAQFIGNAQVVDATVECLDDTADWAILKLPSLVDGTQNLPIFSASTVGARWLAFGYPATAGEHGIALGGVVRDPAGKDSLGRPAVQLFCDEAAAARGAVLGGASGSPVISGGRIIGHLRRLLPDEDDRAQLGMLFACPSLAYQSALPAVSKVPQFQTLGPQSSYDPLWYIPRLDAEKQALFKLSNVGFPVTLQAPEGYGKGWMVQHLLERIAQQDLAVGHKTDVMRVNLRKAMSPEPASLEALLMSPFAGHSGTAWGRAAGCAAGAGKQGPRRCQAQVLPCSGTAGAVTACASYSHHPRRSGSPAPNPAPNGLLHAFASDGRGQDRGVQKPAAPRYDWRRSRVFRDDRSLGVFCAVRAHRP